MPQIKFYSKEQNDALLADKQDILTAGNGINIASDVISVNVGSANAGKYLKVDSNGNLVPQSITEEVWTFTLSDNTTVTRTVLVKQS